MVPEDIVLCPRGETDFQTCNDPRNRTDDPTKRIVSIIKQ